MTIRNVKDLGAAIGGAQLFDLLKRTNRYPTAYPFDRALLGNPSPVAFLTIEGENFALTSAADIWPINIVRTFPTVGFTIGISSGSTADASAGTGAQTIEVDFLDTDYIPHTKTFTMNGQTKVTDTGDFVGKVFRINDVRVKTIGTGTRNAGIIYVYDSTDTVTAGVPQTSTKIFGCIYTGDNQSHSAFYTVPAGCMLQSSEYRGGFRDTVTAARAGIVSLNIYPPSGAWFALALGSQINNTWPWSIVDPGYLTIFDEKTDIVLRGSSTVSSTLLSYLDCVLFYKS